MEPLRTSLTRRDSEKSEERRQQLQANASIRNATDTMIAVTESFRHHYNHHHGGYGPVAPEPTFTHSRSSSVNSISSHKLLEQDPMRPSHIPSQSSSSLSPYTSTNIPSVLLPGGSPEIESQSLLQPAQELDMTEIETRTLLPEHLIRLSTPNLPPRLDTPHTPPARHSIPVILAESDPYASPVSPVAAAPPASDLSVNHGGLVQAARRFEAFRSTTQHHQYIVLRPDVGTPTQPFGTVTHIRARSDPESLMIQDMRRKPLVVDAKLIEFNHHSTNESAFVALIYMAHLLAFAGLAQTLVSARTICESFPKADQAPGHVAWYSAAYALGTGAMTLAGNRLGNICGHRYTFVAGCVWLASWNLLAGPSVYVQNIGGLGTVYFSSCRAMQGVGSALLIPNGHAMLRGAYPSSPRKTLVMGLLDVAAPLGFVLGSIMSGLFATFASWPWAFYSMATVCLALGALSMLIIPSKKVIVLALDFEGSLWKRLDVLGLVVGLAALVLFTVGWNQASIMTFKDWPVYVFIGSGVAGLVAFTLVERNSSHPLVPFKQMHTSAIATLGFTAATWAAFAVWVWQYSQFIGILRDWNSLQLGAGLVPLFVVGAIVGFTGSPFVNNELTAQLSMVVASTAMTVSSALMATAPVEQTYWLNAFFSVILMGIGLVQIIPTTVTVLTRTMPHGHHGLAGSLVNTVAMSAFAISLGMACAVEVGVRDGGSMLEDFRSVQYFGIGLSVLGVVLSSGHVCASYFRD